MSSLIFGSDPNMAIAKKMLDATILRHEALASNLANVQTPGYQRIDLDPSFEAKLQTLFERGDNAGIEALTPSIQKDPNARAIGPDGNNVQLDSEMVQINQNALNHDFLSLFISNNIKHINAAISGEISN